MAMMAVVTAVLMAVMVVLTVMMVLRSASHGNDLAHCSRDSCASNIGALGPRSADSFEEYHDACNFGDGCKLQVG